MIFYLNSRIRWPFYKDDSFCDYFYKHWILSEHKNFEIQISKGGDDLFEFGFRLSPFGGEDHAGFEFHIGLFRRMFMITFYDCRHWNYDKQRWYTDEEARLEAEEYAQEQKGK